MIICQYVNDVYSIYENNYIKKYIKHVNHLYNSIFQREVHDLSNPLMHSLATVESQNEFTCINSVERLCNWFCNFSVNWNIEFENFKLMQNNLLILQKIKTKPCKCNPKNQVFEHFISVFETKKKVTITIKNVTYNFQFVDKNEFLHFIICCLFANTYCKKIKHTKVKNHISKSTFNKKTFTKTFSNRNYFDNEKKTLLSLSKVMNVPNIIQYDNVNKSITMQHCGLDLVHIPLQNFNLLIDVCLKLAEQIQILHSKGIVHGDLKPNNILYNCITKKVYIIDFETCIYVSECDYYQLVPDRFRYTQKYCAPEVINEDLICYKSDIYSFGRICRKLFGNNKSFLDLLYKRNYLAITIQELYEKMIDSDIKKRCNLDRFITDVNFQLAHEELK